MSSEPTIADRGWVKCQAQFVAEQVDGSLCIEVEVEGRTGLYDEIGKALVADVGIEVEA